MKFCFTVLFIIPNVQNDAKPKLYLIETADQLAPSEQLPPGQPQSPSGQQISDYDDKGNIGSNNGLGNIGEGNGFSNIGSNNGNNNIGTGNGNGNIGTGNGNGTIGTGNGNGTIGIGFRNGKLRVGVGAGPGALGILPGSGAGVEAANGAGLNCDEKKGNGCIGNGYGNGN